MAQTSLCLWVSFFIAVLGARQEEVIDHRLTDREWAEEWKHLDNVRICKAAVFNDNHLFTSFKLKQWGGGAKRSAGDESLFYCNWRHADDRDRSC